MQLVVEKLLKMWNILIPIVEMIVLVIYPATDLYWWESESREMEGNTCCMHRTVTYAKHVSKHTYPEYFGNISIHIDNQCVINWL